MVLSRLEAPPRTRHVDRWVVVALVVAGVLAHPVAGMLHRPYWLDEMWVASLSRAPLSRLVSLTSSTPLGWLLLVRLVPGSVDAPLRLVPLAFTVATPPVAYWFVRSMAWPSERTARYAAVTTALVVLFVPAALVRNDLKQYTADAFFALLLLALAGEVEREPNARTVRALVGVAALSVVCSSTAAFVLLAVLGGLLVTARRNRAIVRGAVVAAAATTAWFAAVVVPHTNGALRAFWDDHYLAPTPWRLSPAIVHRIGEVGPMTGVPTVVFVALVFAGIVCLVRVGQPAIAIGVGLLWLEMVLAGIAHQYPFLDLRTSHFLIVVSVAVAALGAVEVVGTVRGCVTKRAALVVAGGLALLFASTSLRYLHKTWTPAENARAAVDYVAQHRAPNDVIIVSFPSNYAFSAYWPDGDTVEYVRSSVSMGFVTRARGAPNVVYVTRRGGPQVAVRDGLALAKTSGAQRLWIIRTHLHPHERADWERAFGVSGLTAQTVALPNEELWSVPLR